MTIHLTQPRYIDGVLASSGTQHTLSAELEAYLVQNQLATWVGGAPDVANMSPVFALRNADGSTSLVGPDGDIPINEIIGLIAGSAAAGSANTVIIQRALTAGGAWRITTPGVYTYTETLVFGDNTTLFIGPGVDLYYADASPQQRFTENTQYGAAGAAITSITTSGNIATVTRTAHGRAVGDWVSLEGAEQTGYNGIHLVATVPTADTYTVLLPVAPAVSTATGTLIEVTPNKNISIIGGGRFTCSHTRTPLGNMNDVGVTFFRVVNLNLEVGVDGHRKYGFGLANTRNVTCGNLPVNITYGDGFHLWGPVINVQLENLTGVSNDDIFAITLGEYSTYELVRGDAFGVNVRNISAKTAFAGIKFAGRAPYAVYDATFGKTRIYSGTSHVQVLGETNLPACYVKKLVIEDAEELNPLTNRGLVEVASAVGLSSVIDELHITTRQVVPTNITFALLYTSHLTASVGKVVFNGCHVEGPSVASNVRYIRQVGAISQAHYNNCTAKNMHSIWDHDSAGSESGQKLYINGVRQIGCNVGINFRRSLTIHCNGWSLETTSTATLSSSAGTCTIYGSPVSTANKHTNLSGTAKVIPFAPFLEVDGDFVTAAKNAEFWNNDAAWASGTGTDKTGRYGYTGAAWTKIFGPA